MTPTEIEQRIDQLLQTPTYSDENASRKALALAVWEGVLQLAEFHETVKRLIP